MPGRFDSDYYAIDLLSDILSRGQSSRLYRQLVKEKEIFTSISSFLIGTIDPGLFVISGRVKDNISLQRCGRRSDSILDQLTAMGLMKKNLKK